MSVGTETNVVDSASSNLTSQSAINPVGIAIPQVIQEDMTNLAGCIARMKVAIQETRDAKKKLHDDSTLWVNNNIKVALQLEQQ